MEDRILVIYEFSRSKVECGDFYHFLGLYSLDKLPTGRRLQQMMNSMVFVVDGWNNDPTEVQTIPEIRRFYRKFQQAWLFWFYFCNLDQDGLKQMVLSCLDNLTTVTVDGREDLVTQPDKTEFAGFLAANLGTMNIICNWANMFDRFVYDRSKAVFACFGVPYRANTPAA